MSRTSSTNPHGETVRRAALPALLQLADLALALGVSESAARRALYAGLCPFSRVGRRLVVRRDALLAAIAARETDRSGAPPPLRLARGAEGGRS